jgi:ornithine decarboxylase
MALENVHALKDQQFYGLAFHVGSDCTSLESYKSAFETVRDFLAILCEYPNFIPHTLDIGGGFSGRSKRDPFFERELAPLLRDETGTLPFARTIAEPGRFFAEEACSLEVPIIGRKKLPCGTDSLTVDDSVYGIFSGVLFDGFKPEFKCITRAGTNIPFTIFGRTCDSADRIAEGVQLPQNCDEGDILRIPNIGAYSYVSASEFNGFPRPNIQVLL